MTAADPALTLRRPADVDEFERIAGEFLRAREAEHNLILGLCSSLRAMTTTAPLTRIVAGAQAQAPYFATVSSGDEVVGAAMRTPPYNALLSALTDDRAVDAIVDDLIAVSPDLSGVIGDKRHARRFAERWTARTRARTGSRPPSGSSSSRP